METLRQMLVRHAEELAELLTSQVTPTPPVRKRRARGPVVVMPEPREMTPERADYAERYVRRALGR